MHVYAKRCIRLNSVCFIAKAVHAPMGGVYANSCELAAASMESEFHVIELSKRNHESYRADIVEC